MKFSAGDTMQYLLCGNGVKIEREHRFAPPRRYRFDFAIIDYKIACELEGGAWVGGRHVRGAGYESDCKKYNLAASLGWVVLRYTPSMIQADGGAQMIKDVKAIINQRRAS